MKKLVAGPDLKPENSDRGGPTGQKNSIPVESIYS